MKFSENLFDSQSKAGILSCACNELMGGSLFHIAPFECYVMCNLKMVVSTVDVFSCFAKSVRGRPVNFIICTIHQFSLLSVPTATNTHLYRFFMAF